MPLKIFRLTPDEAGQVAVKLEALGGDLLRNLGRVPIGVLLLKREVRTAVAVLRRLRERFHFSAGVIRRSASS